ncbi:hypothetical protein FKP32DRAFT_1288643 [Trametes sanguinea]|nr:hypothetical protein FKP32DRAFT_1288643 [Trametes sanguinea]
MSISCLGLQTRPSSRTASWDCPIWYTHFSVSAGTAYMPPSRILSYTSHGSSACLSFRTFAQRPQQAAASTKSSQPGVNSGEVISIPPSSSSFAPNRSSSELLCRHPSSQVSPPVHHRVKAKRWVGRHRLRFSGYLNPTWDRCLRIVQYELLPEVAVDIALNSLNE